MSFLQEFKEFAMRGNVIDLAVGVIIGAAFGKIVDSLVKDVVMPAVGMLVGGVDFSNLYINLSATAYDTLEAAEKAGAPLIKYGVFINTIINFVIIAFAIFVAIKAINKLQRAKPARLERVADDLVLALLVVHAQAPAGDDMLAVGALELEAAHVRPEHHGLQLRAGVLEREIEVPGVPQAAVRQLAFDPDVGKPRLERRADVCGELGDRQRCARNRGRLRLRACPEGR